MNRIEEVAKLSYQFANLIDDKNIDERWAKEKSKDRWYELARQLSPQPLTERKKCLLTPTEIGEAQDSGRKEYERQMELHPDLGHFRDNYEAVAIAEAATDKALALLAKEYMSKQECEECQAQTKFKIEEAEQRGIDTATKAYESTCEALIKEHRREYEAKLKLAKDVARKQEREREYDYFMGTCPHSKKLTYRADCSLCVWEFVEALKGNY